MGKRPRTSKAEKPPPNRLREWRKARDMTLEQVAEAIGSKTPTVAKHETQGSQVTLGQLMKYAELYRVNVVDLLPFSVRDLDDVSEIAASAERLPHGRRRDTLNMIRLYLSEDPAPFEPRPKGAK